YFCFIIFFLFAQEQSMGDHYIKIYITDKYIEIHILCTLALHGKWGSSTENARIYVPIHPMTSSFFHCFCLENNIMLINLGIKETKILILPTAATGKHPTAGHELILLRGIERERDYFSYKWYNCACCIHLCYLLVSYQYA
ncbi:hypothetical protein ACJX0J_040170, partial [Zea mays]